VHHSTEGRDDLSHPPGLSILEWISFGNLYSSVLSHDLFPVYKYQLEWSHPSSLTPHSHSPLPFTLAIISMTPMSNEPQGLTASHSRPYELQIIKLEECTTYPPELLPLRGRKSAIWSSEYSSSGDDSDDDELEAEEYCSSEDESEDESPNDHLERTTKRILNWRSGFSFSNSAFL